MAGQQVSVGTIRGCMNEVMFLSFCFVFNVRRFDRFCRKLVCFLVHPRLTQLDFLVLCGLGQVFQNVYLVMKECHAALIVSLSV